MKHAIAPLSSVWVLASSVELSGCGGQPPSSAGTSGTSVSGTGGASTSSTGAGAGGGGGAGCVTVEDCPKPADACVVRTCDAGTCGTTTAAEGLVLDVQTTGDCQRRQCDGQGAAETVADPADTPPDDGNPCTDDVCFADAPTHPPKADGTPCTDASACTQADSCQAGLCAGIATFGLPGTPLIKLSHAPEKILAADLNGDGKADLVTAGFIKGPSVLLNTTPEAPSRSRSPRRT